MFGSAKSSSAAAPPQDPSEPLRYLALVLAGLFLVGGFAIRLVYNNPSDPVLALYVLPIALVALVWGTRAGMITAGAAFGFYLAWVQIENVHVTLLGHLGRAMVYFPIALLVGIGADQLRRARRGEEASEDRREAILSTANEAFIAVDREGSITSWNPAAERTFGWTAEDAIGAPLGERVVPPRMREGFWEGLRTFLETGEAPLLGQRVEIAAMRRDGTEIPIELSLSAAQEGDDWVFHGFMHDISDRKESERRLRDAARYFELSHDLICTATTDGRFDQLNSRWQKTLGWTPEELRARPFVEFVHEEDREATILETARLGQGQETVDFRNRYRAKDGTWRWLDWTAVIVPEEERIYAAARDASERIEAELANERLGAIVESSDDAIYGSSLDGTVTSWNPSAQRLYGYRPDEATGMSLGRLVPPDIPDDSAALMERIAGGEVVKDRESVRMTKDGDRIDVALSVSPVRDPDGSVVAAATIARDISDRKRTWRYIRAQHQATTILASAPDVDVLGAKILPILAQCMDWTCALYWVRTDDSERLRCEVTWVAPPSRGPVLPAREGTRWELDPGGDPMREPAWVAELTESAPLPLAGHAASGGMKTALWMPVVSEAGLEAGFEFFARASREPDSELMNILATVVAQIGHYVERRRAEQEAERMKGEFFGLISHELRTPLTSIIGYTEAIAETEAEVLSERGRRFLEIVDRNARRELRLVGDLLALVRIEAGTFSIEPASADLAQIAEESVEAARPNAERQGVSLSLTAGEVAAVPGDPYRLGQVIDNLLTNAIKFSPDGGQVDVRLDRRDGQATIEISDRGMGIPPEEQEKLFERLFRAKGATALQIPGTGLGLTIVKAIVDAHGGRVEVESEEGAGTTFRVHLPMRAREGLASAEMKEAST